MASISIITVTYNSAEEIEDFVESVRLQGESVELWIVDNSSTDNTVNIIKNLAEKYSSWIRLIINKKNVGLAAANNMPIDKLTGDFTAIINPDVVLRPGALRALRAYLQKNDDVVAAAPINHYANGEPHSSFHRNWTLLHLLLWRMMPYRLTKEIYRAVRTYNEQAVLFASGSCIMMRSADFQAIGGYDPVYFLTVEDACDLCIRLRRGNRSKKVMVIPDAAITHLGARSSAGAPFVVLWEGACGSIYHFTKHGGALSGRIAYMILFVSSLIRLAGAWLMSFKSSEYRNSLTNNLKVIKGLINNYPLERGKKVNP